VTTALFLEKSKYIKLKDAVQPTCN